MGVAKNKFPYGRLLFVGSNPSRPENVLRPFVNTPSAKRIQVWLDALGLAWDDCLFINASPKFGRIKAKDYDFESLKSLFLKHKIAGVVNLGREAEQFFQMSDFREIPSLDLPHPSPVNRFWNERRTDEICVILLQHFWKHEALDFQIPELYL